MKRLQVELSGSWEYVFCRNERLIDPVVTKDVKKALKKDALSYFKSHYGNHNFRVI